MKGKYPLTRVKLNSLLLHLLSHPEVTLAYRKLKCNEAEVGWLDVMPPTKIIVWVDANSNPLDHISSVIHELLHVVLYPMYIGRLTDDYAEVMILAYEADLYKYVKSTKGVVNKWTSAINAKLTDPETTSVPEQKGTTNGNDLILP